MQAPQPSPSEALVLEGVTKRFGDLEAVSKVDLSIPKGRLVCFLGPSGCGKTTLLRLIAGLELPSAGRILLDEEEITRRPAHRRELGMVFQSLALFPHLSVAENIAYSLRIRGESKAQQRARAEELLELVRLPGVGDRHITQLSGGQRQRVAIARALALSPKLFLMDEPLSALDAKLREEMQIELKLLQQRLGITTIVVTHDQREAMTMADTIVVMRDGKVQQVGSPVEIYRQPANAFVAEFIGTSNLLAGTWRGDGWVEVCGQRLKAASAPEGLLSGAAVTLSVRPEEVQIHPGGAEGWNRLSGRVALVRDVGQSVEIFVDCEENRIVGHVQPKDRPVVEQGGAVTVEFPADACVVLPQ